MTSTAPFTPFRLAITLALTSALSQAAFAGHQDLVTRHRLVRAELSGSLYLPGDGSAVLETIAAQTPLEFAQTHPIVAAKHECDNRAVRACNTGAITP